MTDQPDQPALPGLDGPQIGSMGADAWSRWREVGHAGHRCRVLEVLVPALAGQPGRIVRAPVPEAVTGPGWTPPGPVNPHRISFALDACGLYGPEVDLAVGAAEPEVDLWETGDLAPTLPAVLRLATLTGYPPDWFYLEGGGTLVGAIICVRGGKGRGCHQL